MAIDFENPVKKDGQLYQIIDNELYQVMPETTATQVFVDDSNNLATVINTIQTNLSGTHKLIDDFLNGAADEPVGDINKLVELLGEIERLEGLITALQNGDYVLKSDVVDNLNSTATDVPLSANQGRVLNNKIVEVEETRYAGSVDVDIDDESFGTKVEALNLADGAIFTVIK